jgi:hypothetical protein
MTAGYSAAGACWATPSEAVDAYYSNQQINTNMVQYAGGNLNYHYGEFFKDSGVWKLSLTYCDSVTQSCISPSIRILTTNVYGTCTLSADNSTLDPLTSFTDGALLGWGIVAAMVAAWSIKVLRRGI